MNTDADDGFICCASGSLFGSTICTRATSHAVDLESVADSSCDKP